MEGDEGDGRNRFAALQLTPRGSSNEHRPPAMGPADEPACNGGIVRESRTVGRKRKMMATAEGCADRKPAADAVGQHACKARSAEEQPRDLVIEGPVLSWMQLPVEIKPRNCPDVRMVPGLDDRLQDVLVKEGFTHLMPVQATVWEELAGGRNAMHDVCVCSPTGSGKTLAYALPIFNALSRSAPHSMHYLRALVVLPTRELAVQVFKNFSKLCHAARLLVGILGGTGEPWEETDMLLRQSATVGRERSLVQGLGAVDILVTTPGRLLTHLHCTDGFSLQHLRFLVVDEADKMLKSSYYDWIPTVMEQLSTPGGAYRPLGTPRLSQSWSGALHRCVKIIVSATVSQDPGKLSALDLHCPRCIAPRRAASRYHLPPKLEQFKTVGPAPLRPLLLVGLLQTLKGQRTIVFSSTKETTHRVFILLDLIQELTGPCYEFSKLLSLEDRKHNLQKFQNQEGAILVASDAMSRGMDVRWVENIVNYDTPSNVKMYIHRAGRTARANQAGRVFSLLRRGMDEAVLHKVMQKLGVVDIPEARPDVEHLESLKPAVDQALLGVRDVVADESRGGPEGKAAGDTIRPE